MNIFEFYFVIFSHFIKIKVTVMKTHTHMSEYERIEAKITYSNTHSIFLYSRSKNKKVDNFL